MGSSCRQRSLLTRRWKLQTYAALASASAEVVVMIVSALVSRTHEYEATQAPSKARNILCSVCSEISLRLSAQRPRQADDVKPWVLGQEPLSRLPKRRLDLKLQIGSRGTRPTPPNFGSNMPKAEFSSHSNCRVGRTVTEVS